LILAYLICVGIRSALRGCKGKLAKIATAESNVVLRLLKRALF
jgi:hypothetical protein